jgi:hypothetical protein
MTRDETLAEFDPEFLKGRQRERRWIGGLGALAILALIAAAVSFALSLKTETRVTNFEKSACAKNTTDPTPECEEIRQEIAKHEGIKGPCILHQRVTGERGRNCPQFFVSRSQLQASSTEVPSLKNGSGGEAATGPGGSDAAPAPGDPVDDGPDHPTKPGQPRHDPPSAPPNSGNEGGSAPVEQGGPQGSEGSASSESPASEQSGSETRHESVLESAGATVGEVVNGAGQVVEAAGCGLAGPLLCPKP